MPKMTRRWRYAASAIAVLAFAVPASRITVYEYAAAHPGETLFFSAINALIWFGLVYVVFLAAYGVRRAIRRHPPAP